MKKLIVFILLLFLSITYISSEQIFISGKENRSQLIGAKAINVILTFEGTKIYNSYIDDYIEGIKEEGFILNREEIIFDYTENVNNFLSKKEEKWKTKLINNKSEAKEGFLFVLNYDSLVPIPAIGYAGNATVTVYTVENQDNPILKYKIEVFTMWGSWLPRFAFAKNGLFFGQQIIAFLRKTK